MSGGTAFNQQHGGAVQSPLAFPYTANQKKQKMKIIEKINKLKRPDSIHSIRAYEENANIILDIVAHRTYSQGDENQRFWDISNILADIENMAGVAGIRQDGTIDHEEGRGWFYRVETI